MLTQQNKSCHHRLLASVSHNHSRRMPDSPQHTEPSGAQEEELLHAVKPVGHANAARFDTGPMTWASGERWTKPQSIGIKRPTMTLGTVRVGELAAATPSMAKAATRARLRKIIWPSWWCLIESCSSEGGPSRLETPMIDIHIPTPPLKGLLPGATLLEWPLGSWRGRQPRTPTQTAQHPLAR